MHVESLVTITKRKIKPNVKKNLLQSHRQKLAEARIDKQLVLEAFIRLEKNSETLSLAEVMDSLNIQSEELDEMES